MDTKSFKACFGWGASMDFVYVGTKTSVLGKQEKVLAYLQDLICGSGGQDFGLLTDILLQPDFIPYYLAFSKTMYPTEFARRVSHLRSVFEAAVKAGAMEEATAAALNQEVLERVHAMVTHLSLSL